MEDRMVKIIYLDFVITSQYIYIYIYIYRQYLKIGYINASGYQLQYALKKIRL